jgi:hypothetical protein
MLNKLRLITLIQKLQTRQEELETVKQTKQQVNQVLLKLIQLYHTITLAKQTLQSRTPLKMALLQPRLMQVAQFSHTISLV